MTYTYDVWTEASYDHDGMARQAALARAEAEFADVFPFLALAQSQEEYGHRKALASLRLEAIAMRTGLQPAEVEAMADRHMALYREAIMHTALPEGVNPLDQVLQGAEGQYGTGPEKPDEHSEGPDFSHGYSEVPMGPPGGPPPSVVTPAFESPQQPAEVTGSRRQAALVRQADGMTPMDPSMLPAGVDASGGSPDGMGASGTMPPPPSAGGAGGDPVGTQVTSVARSVAAANPGLPMTECRRVARQVVGRYLHADLNSSVTSDDRSGAPSGGGDGGGGGNPLGHMLEWQGAKSLVKAAPEVAEAAALA